MINTLVLSIILSTSHSQAFENNINNIKDGSLIIFTDFNNIDKDENSKDINCKQIENYIKRNSPIVATKELYLPIVIDLFNIKSGNIIKSERSILTKKNNDQKLHTSDFENLELLTQENYLPKKYKDNDGNSYTIVINNKKPSIAKLNIINTDPVAIELRGEKYQRPINFCIIKE